MADTPLREVACPTCGAAVLWSPENTYRPFCSQRCRLIDLGEWAKENYRLPADAEGPQPGLEEEQPPVR